jgi:hypothetical protein
MIPLIKAMAPTFGGKAALCCRFGDRSRWVPHVYLVLRYL